MAFFYFSPAAFLSLGEYALSCYETLNELQPLSTVAELAVSAATSVGHSMASVATFLATAKANLRAKVMGSVGTDAGAISARISSVKTTALTREPTTVDAAELGQAGPEANART